MWVTATPARSSAPRPRASRASSRAGTELWLPVSTSTGAGPVSRYPAVTRSQPPSRVSISMTPGAISMLMRRRSLVDLDDHLDVVGLAGQRVLEVVEGHRPAHHLLQPAVVGLGQGGGGRLVVTPVGVDRADDGLVGQHQRTVEQSGVDVDAVPARGHTGEAQD